MLQRLAYAQDRHQLGELAVFCYSALTPELKALAPTRESQLKIVTHLEDAIPSGNFTISKNFLVEEVKFSDNSLLDSWCSSPTQLAWMMVHEELSAYFSRYALHRWNPAIFLVHHIPKAAGTSVNQLLERQGHFVAFPQTTFETMCDTYGILGFSSQLTMFSEIYGLDRIYIGGHFNLPDTIRALDLFGHCQGASLCRRPVDILSSAVRYVWTRMEAGDAAFSELYGFRGRSGKEFEQLRREMDVSTQAVGRVIEVLQGIMDSKQFRSEYDEILVKYFYNDEVNDTRSLCTYLKECGDVYVSLDPRHDGAATLAALKVDGSLPYANVSVFPEQQLFSAMGGGEAFAAISKQRMIESDNIYQALTATRTSHSEAR